LPASLRVIDAARYLSVSARPGEDEMKYFAGLDVSLDETAVCIVDEDGVVVRESKVASEPDDVHAWITAAGVTLTRLGLEAGPLSPWLHAGLRAAGLPAICIETRRMKGATAAMAIKTDRNDARAIAHAMRTGWFTAVHVKTPESQELRLLLSNRRTLLEKRVAIDNEIRGTLKAFGLKLGSVTVAAFEARALELLADRSRLVAMIRPMLAARAALRQQCDVLHRMVLGRASEYRVPSLAHSSWCRPDRRIDLCYRRR
jgi:transposase